MFRLCKKDVNTFYTGPMMKSVGMVSAVLMPFFDIPMIVRIVQRKSSEDISLIWTFGIWICILGMLPASLVSSDPIMRAFGIVNAVLFTGVVVSVLLYHPRFRRQSK